MGTMLSVVFTGLCALVVGPEGGPAQVLLVDSTALVGPAGETFPAHAPTLAVRLSDVANAESSDPTSVVAAWPIEAGWSAGRTERVGLWDLSGSEVRIKVSGSSERAEQLEPARSSATSWPAPPEHPDDADAWRDLRFVASMKALTGDGRVDARFTGSVDAELGPGVGARIELPAGRFAGAIPSLASVRHKVFEFRGRQGEVKARQALTDTIEWSPEAGGGVVTIEIVPVAGGPTRRLAFEASSRPVLFIGNLPEGEAHHQHLGDQTAAGIHFGAYYRLLGTPPVEAPMPVSLMEPSHGGKVGSASGPFCPPAIFERP